ncbi:MAG TPA: AMP-binding protein [Mycobacterium sp.]|jgi:long-chain acyl-CoA synthetase|nr:AMP-binding protein [Mycobacterium sp.]
MTLGAVWQSPTINPLSQVLERSVRDQPDAVALVVGTDYWSWSRVDRQAHAAAALLRRRGVGPGQRVLIVGKNSSAHIVTLFACADIGAVFVPLNWRLAERELTELIGDAGCPVVVADDEFGEVVARAEAAGSHRFGIVSTAELLTVSTVDAEASFLPPTTAVVSEDEGVVVQLYTSGTTGRPKGAMYGRENLQAIITRASRAWELGPSDVSLACMPLFHVAGLAWVIASMSVGAPVVLTREFDPAAILDACDHLHITTTLLVPTMVRSLLDEIERTGRRPTLRRLTYSGGPMAQAVQERAQALLGADLCQVYGLSEATGAVTQLDPPDHTGHRLTSVGRPYPWVEIKIADPSTGLAQPVGSEGEIWTRSVQNFRGYYRQPKETAAALREDGWLRTGDIGLLDGDGFLYLRDRYKDMIISGGENVYPAEVEQVLAAYQPVLEAAVIGVPSERWGETVKALVVARPGHLVRPQDVIAFTRTRLAAFKCPTSVDVVEALPHTPTGKVRKDILRKPYWHDADRRVS